MFWQSDTKFFRPSANSKQSQFFLIKNFIGAVVVGTPRTPAVSSHPLPTDLRAYIPHFKPAYRNTTKALLNYPKLNMVLAVTKANPPENSFCFPYLKHL